MLLVVTLSVFRTLLQYSFRMIGAPNKQVQSGGNGHGLMDVQGCRTQHFTIP